MKYEDSPINKMVEKALKEALESDKNFQITKKELKNLVKQTLLEEAINNKKKKLNKLNEAISRIEEEDEIPYDWQDFDALDFKTSAKDAAAKDIADEFGEEMPELGSEEDADEFVSDLERANLRLPSDEEDLEKIKQMMDKKKAAKQSMGSYSLNEGDVPVLADSMISLGDDEQANLQDMLQQKLAEKQAKHKNSIYTGEEIISEGEKNKMLKLMGVIKEEYPGQFVFDSKKDDQK